MAARPFLRSNLIKHSGTIKAIVGATIKPGQIGQAAQTNRSGILGAGAKKAGY
jgi:hypothetical protein